MAVRELVKDRSLNSESDKNGIKINISQEELTDMMKEAWDVTKNNLNTGSKEKDDTEVDSKNMK